MLRQKLEEKKYEFENNFLQDFSGKFEEKLNEYEKNLKRFRDTKRELKKMFDEFSPYIEEKNVRELIESYKEEQEVIEHNIIDKQTKESIQQLYVLGVEYKKRMHENLPGKCNEAIIYLRERIAKILVKNLRNEEKKQENNEINNMNIEHKENKNDTEVNKDEHEKINDKKLDIEKEKNKAMIFLDALSKEEKISEEHIQEFILSSYQVQYHIFDLFRKMKKYTDMRQMFFIHFSANVNNKDTLEAKFLDKGRAFTKEKKVRKILERMIIILQKKEHNTEEKKEEEKWTYIEPIKKNTIFSQEDELFSVIIIKKEENISSVPAIFQEQQKGDIIPGLPEIIQLPQFDTIEEMEEINSMIPQEVTDTLIYLENKTPEINFKKLSIIQLNEISEYVKKIDKMNNKEIMKLIESYAGSMFYIRLEYNTYKKMDAKHQKIINDEYIKGPQKKTIEEIAQRTLQGMNKKNNIDILRDNECYNFTSPITTLLVFLKVQKDIYPERTKKISKTLISPFQKIIDRHTDFSLQLMFDKEGNINKNARNELFGKEKNEELKMELKVLKSIMYNTELTHSISPKQEYRVLQTFENYKNVLQIVFLSDQEGKYKHLFEGKPERRKGNINMAYQEIIEKFDDGATNKFAQRIVQKKNFPTISEIINSIYMQPKTQRTKPIENLMKSGIGGCREHLKGFIQDYFNSTQKERKDTKEKKIQAFKNEYSYLQTIFIERFFNLLDQYI